jgi:hypothetical protein
MTRFREYTRRVRVVAVVAGGAFLNACMTWKTQSLQPERFNAADSTQTMRVVLRSGDTLIVRGPVITGDSLTGLRTKPGASADSLERVGVPLGAIDHAEAPMFDVAGLFLTALGVAAFVVIMKAALRCIPWCPGSGPGTR